ncbi:MAG: flagella basal body P-ring formation protein FlgA [Planctomycetes bacterium]|nr:flagella basal body P-ring formation protein FlgA [Planctomycetota bacterium]
MKWKILILLWLAPAVPLRASAEESLGEARKMLLVLKASAAAAPPFVALADIAEFPNDPLALRAPAAALFIGLTPKSGEVRSIPRGEVLERLRTAGLPVEKIRLEGAQETVVLASREEVRPDPGLDAGDARRPRPAASGKPAADLKPVPSSKKGSDDPDPAVKEGDVLILKSDRGVVQIEEPVKALAAGKAGDLIPVANLRTGKNLTAKVLDPQAVVPAGTAGPPPAPEKKSRAKK